MKSGLGLYIVSQVVQAHGGSISVANNQPQGTVFTIQV
ncbi:MAG: HAMP domain-containing histidine kinase [Saprospirales bacterium]|nr:HAMP domain-containing histidine kinase [Saprospirales bacterium]